MSPTRHRRSTVRSLDVRGFLCAQALAEVAQVVETLAVGDALDIWYTTDEVQRDLVAWGEMMGHAMAVRDRTPTDRHLVLNREPTAP